MGNVNQSAVADIALMEENTEFGNVPAGKFAKNKILIAFSLIIDLMVYISIMFNILHLQMNSSVWLSAAHVVTLLTVFAMVLSTIYAMFGLVTMNLSRFVFIIFSWLLTVLTVFLMFVTMFISLFLSFGARHSKEHLYIQTTTCTFLRTNSYCELTKIEYVFVIAVVCASIFMFKAGQLIGLRALCLECHDFLERKTGSKSRRTKQAENSESDEDDVVVFERVSGRYPGGSSIKDASIA